MQVIILWRASRCGGVIRVSKQNSQKKKTSHREFTMKQPSSVTMMLLNCLLLISLIENSIATPSIDIEPNKGNGLYTLYSFIF